MSLEKTQHPCCQVSTDELINRTSSRRRLISGRQGAISTDKEAQRDGGLNVCLYPPNRPFSNSQDPSLPNKQPNFTEKPR